MAKSIGFLLSRKLIVLMSELVFNIGRYSSGKQIGISWGNGEEFLEENGGLLINPRLCLEEPESR
jgi:hypothetical protein